MQIYIFTSYAYTIVCVLRSCTFNGEVFKRTGNYFGNSTRRIFVCNMVIQMMTVMIFDQQILNIHISKIHGMILGGYVFPQYSCVAIQQV